MPSLTGMLDAADWDIPDEVLTNGVPISELQAVTSLDKTEGRLKVVAVRFRIRFAYIMVSVFGLPHVGLHDITTKLAGSV